MNFDWQTLHLDPIYAVQGVSADVTLADSDATVVTGLTVIDKTAGIQTGANEVKVDTIEPACCIRASEWKARGYVPLDFEDASIAFNGSRWKIVGFPKRPVPSGGSMRGEIMLILSGETVIDEESS